MTGLTGRQLEVLDCLQRWHDEGRIIFPTDVARELGIHYVSLRQHLQALERKGFVEFESRGRGRMPIIGLVVGSGEVGA